ncbi:MAG: hypothetical protein ACPF8V_09090, partial [Luteibaculum sp.]
TAPYQQLNFKQLVKQLSLALHEKIRPQFNVTEMIDAYLSGDEGKYFSQKAFFQIDIRKKLDEGILRERDKLENLPFPESYIHLHNLLFSKLIPAFKKGQFYPIPVVMGMGYQEEYVIRHFLRIANRDNYLRAITYCVEVLFFQKAPYHPIFLFRINLEDQQKVAEFFHENFAAIHFQNRVDYEDYQSIGSGEKINQQYVQRWEQLSNTVQNSDVILISSFKGIGVKLGIINKRDQPVEIRSGSSTFLGFKIHDAREIDLEKYPFINTLLPNQTTLSRVKRRNYKIRKLSHDMVTPSGTEDYDDITYEILVGEWLRSNFAPKEFRLKYQLLKTGGNLKGIDILGCTYSGKKLVAQVSNTSDLKTIKKKIKAMLPFEGYERVLFVRSSKYIEKGCHILPLPSVVEDLRKDDFYRELFLELD